MRDYKHISVPKSYGSGSRRISAKRARTGGRSLHAHTSGIGTAKQLVRIMLLLLVGAAAYLGWQGYQALLHADGFTVSAVDVKGVKHLQENDIKELAAPFTGQNIFRVDLESAVKRALANPWVREASIHRTLPNRITMVITERVPGCIVDTGTARFLADEDGMLIERLPREYAPAEYPLPVVAVRDTRLHSGEEIVSEAYSGAVQLIAELAGRGGWNMADVRIRADSPEGLSVLYAGHEFKFGSGRYEVKLRRLADVLADANQRSIEIASVDLRPERQVAVMTAKAQGQGPRGKGPGAKGKGKRA